MQKSVLGQKEKRLGLVFFDYLFENYSKSFGFIVVLPENSAFFDAFFNNS